MCVQNATDEYLAQPDRRPSASSALSVSDVQQDAVRLSPNSCSESSCRQTPSTTQCSQSSQCSPSSQQLSSPQSTDARRTSACVTPVSDHYSTLARATATIPMFRSCDSPMATKLTHRDQLKNTRNFLKDEEELLHAIRSLLIEFPQNLHVWIRLL